MSSLERFTARIVALTRTLRQHPLFAALEPVPVRQRLRLPASGPRNWRRYPGFAEPTGLAGRRSRRAPVSPWHAMVLASAVLAVSGVVVDARAADARTVSGQSANGNIEDARRQTQIATVYAINPLLRDSVLIVTVNGANVSLVGKTASSVERDLAEEIALSV
ncbi:MAG TPA: BON domain-containing protein, partial [Rhodanobacteraceae bacterium]